MHVKRLIVFPTLIVAFCLASQAAEFDFSYSFRVNGVPDGVTASGILTTTPFDPVAMDYTIIGITGSRTVAAL
jgi:hypothetical protein